ncbi:MAG: hypothetical protein QHH06_04095 [Clostridiales bacterium]|nr:hypothetical protein [Eubacteriales bacterium]MDH7565648.1 hypothetical protein [Clostridiales bacterium]
MNLNPEIRSVRSYKQLQNPRLKKALDILEMNAQDLLEYVQEQLETNPVLELVDSDGDLEFESPCPQGEAEEEADASDMEASGEKENDGIEEMRDFIIHNYVIPDLVIRKIKNKFEVFLYDEAVPNIRINSFYKSMACEDMGEEAKEFIREKLESAKSLIKHIEERGSILRDVGEYIVNSQRDFFERGKKYLRKISIKEAAKDLNIHRSILTRAVNGKHIQCIWGYFAMEQFLSCGKLSNDDTKSVRRNIKNMIQEIIKSENRMNPMSDVKILSVLREKGINISRSAVSKYRNEMGIAASNKRKQMRSNNNY